MTFIGSVGDRLGMVAPGKLADLIAMPASPLDDIRNLRGLDYVMIDGEVPRAVPGPASA